MNNQCFISFFFCTGNSSSSEKMDQLQLPEGFRPDYKPKYVFYILKKTLKFPLKMISENSM